MKLFATRIRERAARLQRRTFLKAVGLGISAPLALKMSQLAVAQTGERPTRMFLFYLPHGMPIEHWDVGDAMDFSMSGVGIFSPLEAYRDYVTVVRGVGINTSTNHAAIRSTFTGTESSNSIDFEVATRLQTTAHVLGAHANPSGAGADGQLLHHGGWVDPIANPADALDDLFAGLGAGEPSDTAVDEAEFRKEALALTEGELESLQSGLKDLSGEQSKLQAHLESLRAYRAVAEGGGGVGVSCSVRPSLPSAEFMAGKDAYDPSLLGSVIDGHLEAAAYSMLCGSSRVISMQNLFANAKIMMDFEGGPGIAEAHHDPLSHYSKGQDAGREKFAQVQKWFVSRLVEKFISVLDVDDPADPGRKVLDNTTILTMSEVVDGSNHTSAYTSQTWDVPGGPRETYLPSVIIGKGGGAFKGGQSVYVPGMDHRNLLATAAYGMGVSLSEFANLNVSPIAEVLA